MQTEAVDSQPPTSQKTENHNKLQRKGTELREVPDITRHNTTKVTEREDEILSELDYRASALECRATRFEHEVAALKKDCRTRDLKANTAIGMLSFIVAAAFLFLFLNWSFLTGRPSQPAQRPVSASPHSLARFGLNVLANEVSDLYVDGWIQGKPCRVIIDTGESVSIARPDIVAGLPARKTTRSYSLAMASGQTIPIDKEALVELTLGRCVLNVWVFVADIVDDFILGLDVLRAYDASVNVGQGTLRLRGETCQGQKRLQCRQETEAGMPEEPVISGDCPRTVTVQQQEEPKLYSGREALRREL